jgi:hypothetical protein
MDAVNDRKPCCVSCRKTTGVAKTEKWTTLVHFSDDFVSFDSCVCASNVMLLVRPGFGPKLRVVVLIRRQGVVWLGKPVSPVSVLAGRMRPRRRPWATPICSSK